MSMIAEAIESPQLSAFWMNQIVDAKPSSNAFVKYNLCLKNFFQTRNV